MKEAMMVIMSCDDPTNEQWEYVKPEDVPEWLKDPSAMGRLVNGEIIQGAGSDTFYIGEQVEGVKV
jgi:hypothetical protein